MLEVRLLGQFDVKRDGTAVTIPSRTAQTLFAYLILTAGTAHLREKLASLVSPDTAAEIALKDLHHELGLGKAIGTKASRQRTVAYFRFDKTSISFDPQSEYWLDVAVLKKPLSKRVSADALIGTLSLYRGKLLPSWYDDWVVLEREHIHALFEQRMTRLLELLIQEQRWQQVLEWGERWIVLGQTPEPAYRALMVAHHALGHESQVDSVYGRCIRAMRNDLGIEPPEQIRALYERLSKSESSSQVSQARATSPPPQRYETHDEASPALSHPIPSSHLPIPLTSFIGREREIEQVERSFTTTRLLTLIGAGGIGKTRLAIRVAGDLAHQSESQVWWVDFAALSDPELVPQTVVTALGLNERRDRSISESLIDFLRSKRIVLILDNCEHLRDACKNIIEEMLSACPDLRILTTSRESLNCPGELTWLVPSLSAPTTSDIASPEQLMQSEAVRLFVERARAAQGGQPFTLTTQNAVSVSRICQRLEGMPLAIELAAARAGVLSASQIALRLDNMFQILTRGTPELLPRHQTLRAAMDWSFDLLSEQERVLFRRLAVFQGGFALETIEEICADEIIDREYILDRLSELIDKSLVLVSNRQGMQARFRLLESIRQYAWEKLQESGEANAIRQRHCDWFLKMAETAHAEWRGPKQKELFDQLEIEHDNLRAALDWSTRESSGAEMGLRLGIALWRFWEVHSHYSEGRRHMAQLLTLPEAARRTALRGQALNVAGYLAFVQGDYDAASMFLGEGLDIAHELDDPRLTADITYSLGLAARIRGDTGDSVELLETSLTAYQGLHDRVGTYITLYNLAEAARELGDYGRAFALHKESLALKREQGDRWSIANSLWSLAILCLQRGERQRAAEFVEESLSLFRDLGDIGDCALCLDTVAAIELGERRPGAVVRLAGAADRLFEITGFIRDDSGRRDHDRHLQIARAQLGENKYATHWQAGHAMTMDEAFDYAQNLLTAFRSNKTPTQQNLSTARMLGLSEREFEVAVRIAQGKSNREIADDLVLGVRTIETHVTNLLNKLGFNKRTQIKKWMIDHDLESE